MVEGGLSACSVRGPLIRRPAEVEPIDDAALADRYSGGPAVNAISPTDRALRIGQQLEGKPQLLTNAIDRRGVLSVSYRQNDNLLPRAIVSSLKST
jgi:hypothetical protein